MAGIPIAEVRKSVDAATNAGATPGATQPAVNPAITSVEEQNAKKAKADRIAYLENQISNIRDQGLNDEDPTQNYMRSSILERITKELATIKGGA